MLRGSREALRTQMEVPKNRQCMCKLLGRVLASLERRAPGQKSAGAAVFKLRGQMTGSPGMAGAHVQRESGLAHHGVPHERLSPSNLASMQSRSPVTIVHATERSDKEMPGLA